MVKPKLYTFYGYATASGVIRSQLNQIDAFVTSVIAFFFGISALFVLTGIGFFLIDGRLA